MKNQAMFTKVKMMIGVLALALSVSACGKKNDDGGSVANNNPYYGGLNCAGCFQGGQIIFGAVQATTSSGSFGMTMDIIGQGTGYMGYQNGYTGYQPYQQIYTPGQSYINNVNGGSVMVVGQMQVSAPSALLCYANPMIYSLQTVMPGTLNNGVISGIRIEAIGQDGWSRISLEGSGILHNITSGNGGIRIGLNMMATVNGQPCGQMTTY